MKIGDFYSARDPYELFGVLRAQLSLSHFFEDKKACFQFLQSGHGFFCAGNFVSDSQESVWKYQEELNYKGLFLVLDSTGEIDEAVFGCDDFVIELRLTEINDWVHSFEFVGEDLRYEKFVEDQVISSFQALKKILE